MSVGSITVNFRKVGYHARHTEAADLLRKLFRDTPLYSNVEIDEELREACLEILLNHGLRMDTWCIGCKATSTFALLPLLDNDTKESLERAELFSSIVASVPYKIKRDLIAEVLRWVQFCCARNDGHILTYVLKHRFRYDMSDLDDIKELDIGFNKIGQEPSPADIALAETRQYAQELSDADFKEFSRAIGLASHDVGIGSFVYLRRILSRLIEETAKEQLNDDALKEFSNSPTKERIKIVKQWLPTFLVENTTLFNILSKGIHELTEEECLAAFELCRAGIELILDEHIAEKQKAKKIDEASQKLRKLSTKLGKQ